MSTLENEVMILKGMLRRAAELIQEQKWLIDEAEKGNKDSVYRSQKAQSARVADRLRTELQPHGIII